MNVCWRGCGDGVGWDGVYGMSEGGRCDADEIGDLLFGHGLAGAGTRRGSW